MRRAVSVASRERNYSHSFRNNFNSFSVQNEFDNHQSDKIRKSIMIFQCPLCRKEIDSSSGKLLESVFKKDTCDSVHGFSNNYDHSLANNVNNNSSFGDFNGPNNSFRCQDDQLQRLYEIFPNQSPNFLEAILNSRGSLESAVEDLLNN